MDYKKDIPQFGLEPSKKMGPPTKSEWIPDACGGDEILVGKCDKVKKK